MPADLCRAGIGALMGHCDQFCGNSGILRLRCMQVGHMQPVAWFRFHNRRDYKRWAALAQPKTLWEGPDSDLDIRRTRRPLTSRGASPEQPGVLCTHN